MYHFGDRYYSMDMLGKGKNKFVDFIKCVVQLHLVMFLFEITQETK